MNTARLDALETSYLRAETAGAPLHVAAVGFFEADPLYDDDGRFRLAELRAHIAERLGALPKLRQVIAEVPFEAGRPVWVDDDSFDIERHVERVRLDEPGDLQALMELVTTRYSEPLDRARPLWHLLFITGVEGNRVALLERAHHSLVDGVGGVELATMLLDLERAPTPAPLPPLPVAEPRPGALELLTASIRDAVLTPPKLAAGLAATVARHPLGAVGHVRDALASIRTLSSEGWFAPHSSLNVPTSDSRRIAFVRGELDAFKRAGKDHNATVNDMVLSVVTTALREQLIGRGEFVRSDAKLKALIPVSVRSGTDEHGAGNHVAGLVVNLPIGVGDAAARIADIAASTAHLKESHEDAGTLAMLEAANALPPVVLDSAGLLMQHQPIVNVVITNVPGPPLPLYALGAELKEVFPVVPIYGNLTIGIAVLSYNGSLNFGITSDPVTCPDVGVFVGALRRGVRELTDRR